VPIREKLAESFHLIGRGAPRDDFSKRTQFQPSVRPPPKLRATDSNESVDGVRTPIRLADSLAHGTRSADLEFIDVNGGRILASFHEIGRRPEHLRGATVI
jgi:hypothetical protein